MAALEAEVSQGDNNEAVCLFLACIRRQDDIFMTSF